MQNRYQRGVLQLPARGVLSPQPLAGLLTVVCVAVVLLVSAYAPRASAYPWMIKHGYTNCSGCHADPSGGELLTLYGHAISYEALSTKWHGSSESAAAAERRRVARAIAAAAHAKSAPRKKIVAEKVELDEEPAPAPADKPGAPAAPAAPAPAAGEKPSTNDAQATDQATPAGEGTPAAGDAEQAGEASKENKGQAAKKGEAEDEGEEAAEEEASEEEPAAPAQAEASSSSAASGAEPSPFEGMSRQTGPLFGLMKPNENLLLGGSWRFAALYKADAKDFSFFPMQLDMYGQWRFAKNFRAGLSLGAVKVPAGSPHARAAQITTNQENGYNLISRTHWIGLDLGGGAHLLRAGRMNLPFGVRMSEHIMWVRDKTQTDRESDQQHGVSLFMSFEKIRFEVMAILGNYQINPDQFRERGYSGYLEYILAEKATLGANSLYTEAGNDHTNPEGLRTARGAHGLFFRAGPSTKVAILAEADILTRSRREVGYVGFLQLDTEPFSGIHLIGTAELLDAGFPTNGGPNGSLSRSPGQGQPSAGGWLSLQWFFLPHFDFRVDAIIREDKWLLSQLHIYL